MGKKHRKLMYIDELPKGIGEIVLLRKTLSWITILNYHPLE